jgi:two-component system nitrate/nitrite sensor histidine kinase NarX
MGTPLRSGGKVTGVLSVSSDQPGLYNSYILPILEAFANHAAIAMTNARLYQEARNVAAVEERNRLARDLHDAVTQTLFSASIIAEALPLQWEQDQDGARENLDRLHQLTSGALAEMRMLLLELRPASLQQTTLSTLLRNLLDAFQAKNNVHVDIQVEEDGGADLPGEVKEYFYRITQEALNNITKHSKASLVEVRLKANSDGVSLRIQDDGKGFDMDQVPTGRLGLQIMGERAAAIAANLQIESGSGAGTILSSKWKRSR